MLEDLPDAGAAARAECVAHLLRRYLTSQGVAVDVFDRLASCLAPHWARYVELLVSDDGGSLALLTRGRGREFIVQLSSVLTCCEIEPRAATRLLALAESCHPGQCFLRLGFERSGDPRPEVSLLQRRALSTARGLDVLAEPAVGAAVHACAALLGVAAIHGVALTARPGSAQLVPAVRFARTITARCREAVRMQLAHVASRYAPCAAAVSAWAEHHDRWLMQEPAMVSLWLVPTVAEVRIEYPEVPVVAAAGWLEQGSNEVSERFQALCAAAARPRLSYLEVSLQRSRVPRMFAAARVGERGQI